MLNKDIFAEGFVGICEMFDKEPSPSLSKMYYEALKHLSDDEYKSACVNIIKTRKYTKIPMPADFMEHTHGNIEGRALEAALKLERATRSVGAYQSVAFDDPIIHMIVGHQEGGWVGVCHIKVDEWKWYEKRFVEQYKIYLNRPLGEYPKVLVGMTETDNIMDSMGSGAAPVYIGDLKAIKALMSEYEAEEYKE